MNTLHTQAQRVKAASRALARQSTHAKNDALTQMANQLRQQSARILEANAKDLQAGTEKGLSAAFLDRLKLDEQRIDAMARAVEEIIELPDPIGRVDKMWKRPNGLRVGKQRIPLGVVGIIYESRPNVTSDATALCLKSGNGVMLKGGSDAFESNLAIYHALSDGLKASVLDPQAQAAIGFVETRDRAAVETILQFDDCIDVIIPRGGHRLIQFVNTHARMPVIKHDEGICHLIVEGSAKPDDVERIVLNAKTQRPGVCNAIENLLLTQNAVDTHLVPLLRTLKEAGVRLHLCPKSQEIAQTKLNWTLEKDFVEATETSYATEFLSLELAIRVVDDLDAAIDHLDQYSSNHTESLLTQRYDLSQEFLRKVDSAVVMINASTRFSDGGQLGLGAEIGISTTRMHAYGPMGIEELTTTKFIILGDGQIRQ